MIIISLLLGVFFLVTALFNRPSILWVLLAALSFAFYFGLPDLNLMVYLVFILGIILMIIELYVPDFGIIGLIGFGASIYGLYTQSPDISALLLDVLAMILVIVVSVIFYLKIGKDLVITPAFVLESSLTKQDGYSSQKDLTYLLNAKGTARSDLRPVGRAMFEDDLFEVVSEENFISSGTPIYVEKVIGSKIYVREDISHV